MRIDAGIYSIGIRYTLKMFVDIDQYDYFFTPISVLLLVIFALPMYVSYRFTTDFSAKTIKWFCVEMSIFAYMAMVSINDELTYILPMQITTRGLLSVMAFLAAYLFYRVLHRNLLTLVSVA